MKHYLFKLLYKNMHVLSVIDNLQNIIDELEAKNINISCIDDLFNNNIMQDYALQVVILN